jgi:hypothetical protein
MIANLGDSLASFRTASAPKSPNMGDFDTEKFLEVLEFLLLKVPHIWGFRGFPDSQSKRTISVKLIPN